MPENEAETETETMPAMVSGAAAVTSTLTVDPRVALPYYTYVIEGFTRSGIADRVRFRHVDLPVAPGPSAAAMVLEGPATGRDGPLRIAVSTDDGTEIVSGLLEWADVYGKVNVDPAAPRAAKVLPLGPVFGTTLWSLPRGHFAAAAMSRSPRAFAQKMREVRFQAITRLPLSAYVPRASTDGYVFHASRAWGGRHADTNAPRQRFLDACATLGVPVDGGLGDARMPLAEYVQRTQRSAVVFNCPAVHRCLGWKLGEYLALGKAVVSTPLARELPAPLVHGRHVHLVDDDVESIAAGVRAVLADADYRRRLERGARAWFDDHLAPPKVAQRLVAHGRA